MIWNPFKPRTQNKEILFPQKLSKCIETIALIFTTQGYPFNKWKHNNQPLDEIDDLFYTRVCNAHQLATVSRIIENICDSEELGAICVHSIFENIALTVSSIRKSLYFYNSLIDEFIWEQTIVNVKSGGEDLKDIHPHFFAAYRWYKFEYQSRDINDDIPDEKIAELAKNIQYAVNEARTFFDKMLKNVDVDITNINPIGFLEERSIYEEILFRKQEYPEVFSRETQINAFELLDARQKEKQYFGSMFNQIEEFKLKTVNIINKIVEYEGGLEDLEPTYNEFTDLIFSIDDARRKCLIIGGRLKKLISEIEECRARAKDFFSILMNNDELKDSHFQLFYNFFENADKSNNEMNEQIAIFTINELESEDIAPYILTCDDETLRQYSKLENAKSLAVGLKSFVDDLVFKLKAKDIDEAILKMKFLMDKVKIFSGD